VCQDRTKGTDADLARVIQPCPAFHEHLLTLFFEDQQIRDTDVTRATLRAFGTVSLIVLELEYFDIDYRSEFSAVLEDSFGVDDHRTARLHFFRDTEDPAAEVDLRVCLEAALTPYEAEATDRADVANEGLQRPRSRYLGYVIVRPQSPGTIGRSIVSPVEERVELAEGEALETRVRTIVREPVDIFGLQAQAYGVPFMEQDGRLLRCAHVAAWMCHYTAVLRGLAHRLRTAEFNPSKGPHPSLSRRYPSTGLTDVMLAKVLRNIGFPAEAITVGTLIKRRPALWTDRPAMYEHAMTPDVPGERRSRDDLEFWLRESLTATACRYLNSGLPLVLARNHRGHAQVICGYVRDEDLAGNANADLDPSHSDVSAFLVNDDLVGPFQLESIDELISDTLDGPRLEAKSWPFSLLVPLPRGLWLEGGLAEAAGANAIAGACEQLETWAAGHEASMSDAAQALLEFIRTRRANETTTAAGYAVRSFAMTGTDFKRSYSEVVEDERAARAVSKIQLPKFVWVVEILDRSLRPGPNDQPRPAVVATAIVDGSAVAHSGWGTERISVLAVHLPGHLSTYRSDWEEVTDAPRYTCRWNHYREWLTSPQASAERGKEI